MPVTNDQLTTVSVDGTGIFDILMRSVKAHLESEFRSNRIKGAEYATVYLGSMNLAMQSGLQFLLQRDKQSLEEQLLAKQIELANVQVQKAQVELDILEASKPKIEAEIALLEAQANLTSQNALNAVVEGTNLVKQGTVLERQASHLSQQTTNLSLEALNIPKQGAVLDAQEDKLVQDTANAVIEGQNLVKQGLMVDAQRTHITQQTSNLALEAVNIPKQGEVLDAQVCKLEAEFDNIQAQTVRVNQETTLLTQKVATEKAQTQAVGVDADSVIGRQKGLYVAQTDGFKRDAEQKAAKLMAETWSVRRTTDEATSANTTNKLDDATVGAFIDKMRAGVGA